MTTTLVSFSWSLKDITLMPEFSLKPFLKRLVVKHFLKRFVVVVQ
jgi:hypothetical protein